MISSQARDSDRKVILPDWLGSGQDLFGTIQIIQGKKIDKAFLEIDFDFKFSETFNYPIIFEIKSRNSDIEAYAIAFRIGEGKGDAQRVIEEQIIAPKVCSILRLDDFIKFFADVVEKDIDFALYINRTPEKFKKIKVYSLSEKQRVIFDQRLILAITEILDQRMG